VTISALMFQHATVSDDLCYGSQGLARQGWRLSRPGYAHREDAHRARNAGHHRRRAAARAAAHARLWSSPGTVSRRRYNFDYDSTSTGSLVGLLACLHTAGSKQALSHPHAWRLRCVHVRRTVTKTMSVPCSAASICALLSFAAFCGTQDDTYHAVLCVAWYITPSPGQ